MPKFDVMFSFMQPDYGRVTVEAEDREDARDVAYGEIMADWPEAREVEIDFVKEAKEG